MDGFRLEGQHSEPDRYPNLITCSFYHPGPLHKSLSQSVHNVLNTVANKQTDRTTDKQTNTTENIISFEEITLIGSLLAVKTATTYENNYM